MNPQNPTYQNYLLLFAPKYQNYLAYQKTQRNPLYLNYH
jgi:hypothetical protein